MVIKLRKKMTKNITLSLNSEDVEFLNNNPELSPTKMLRSKIHEVRDSRSDINRELIKCRNNNSKLNSIIKELGNTINVLEEKKLRE